jgi:hypothetical protein
MYEMHFIWLDGIWTSEGINALAGAIESSHPYPTRCRVSSRAALSIFRCTGRRRRCVELERRLEGWGSQRMQSPKVPIQATNRAPVPGSLILPSSNVLCRLGSHVNVGLDGLSERCATDRGCRRTRSPPRGATVPLALDLLSVLHPRLIYAAISWSHHRGLSSSPPDPPLPAPITKT